MSKFKVGDRVKVVRKVEKEEGWGNTWVERMDEMIGHVYEVIQVYQYYQYYQYYGIVLEDNYGCTFAFPPSSLELVEDNSMKTFINEDKIRFKDLTAEQQHIIIDGIANDIAESYNRSSGEWLKSPTNYIMLNNCYRIKPNKPTKQLVIPWQFIKPEYNYAAMDKNGKVFVYPSKPYIDGNYWVIDDNEDVECISNVMSIDTDGIDWEDSLIKRPE